MVKQLSLQSLVLALSVSSAAAQTLTAEMITSMGNNSLFTRWRPRSRIIAPAGWMNDPCGPMYDNTTGLYHMHYQWHPNHFGWGNISWGHATSPDFINWTDVNHSPNGQVDVAWQNDLAQSIGTTNLTGNHTPPKYNFLGIFSGTAQPVSLTGEENGTLLAFYTSVSELPFSWDQTYPMGAESQSLAYSNDGGITWDEYEANPVLPTPPDGWNITGWRDPFFLALPELDTLLNQSEPHHYVIFGSGINQTGPRAPLYSAPSSDLTNWTYLGALSEPGVNESLGDPVQTGTWGQQWEVPNFFNLGEYWFVSSGIQGGIPLFRSFWNEGNISARDNGSVEFTPISGGAADWGQLYAITSFNDTKNDRRIQLGWSIDETNGFGDIQNGYQGSLSLPRELYILETSNVVPPTNLSQPGNSVLTQQSDGSYTARTLGARPAPDVVDGLRQGAAYTDLTRNNYTGAGNGSSSLILANMTTTSYEILLTINDTNTLTADTGIIIAASPNFEEYTTISYSPSTSTIACIRDHSSLISNFTNTTYQGYFKLYNSTLTNTTEAMTIRVFVDGSLVEISVNDRFWLTSRIYPTREDSVGFGIFADQAAEINYSRIEVWDGTLNVWPNRPSDGNSSSLLVFDDAAETNNYTWWSGM